MINKLQGHKNVIDNYVFHNGLVVIWMSKPNSLMGKQRAYYVIRIPYLSNYLAKMRFGVN